MRFLAGVIAAAALASVVPGPSLITHGPRGRRLVAATNDAAVDAERRVREHEQFAEAWWLSKRTLEKLYACGPAPLSRVA